MQTGVSILVNRLMVITDEKSKTKTSLHVSSLILQYQYEMFAAGYRTSSQTFTLIIKHIMSTLGYRGSQVHVNVAAEATEF